MVKNCKKEELSNENKGRILGLHESGLSQRAIALKIPCGKSTVYDVLKKYRQTGSIKNRKRSGHPQATTTSQDK